MDITTQLANIALQTYQGLVNTGEGIKKGVLAVGKEGSQILYDFYCMDGLLTLTKVFIADLRFISLIPAIDGLFAEVLKTLEAQKALYYATLTPRALVECIKVDPVTGKMGLQLPQMHDGSGINYVNICYCLGGIFETGSYLKKMCVLKLEMFSQVGSKLATIKIFSLHGEAWTFSDIPVVNRLCTTPKEVFFMGASALEVSRWLIKVVMPDDDDEFIQQFSLINLLKVTESFARLLTIGMHHQHGKKWWFLTIDLIGQNACLFKFILIRRKIHQNHYENPGTKVDIY